MTTPERLRARQRRESFMVFLVAVGLVFSVIYFREQDKAGDRRDDATIAALREQQADLKAQAACLRAYIETQSGTSRIRADLVERESKATRQIIRAAGSVTTREDFERALARYDAELHAIDTARDDNPPPTLPEGVCD